MLLNKYIQFGLSAVGGLAALAASLDWTTILSQKGAAGVATGILVIKAITNLFAPAPGVAATPTNSSIVTHN